MLRIKEILSERKKTSKNLALDMGVAENTISAIINEKSSPRLDTLEKIANALDVDIRELFVSTKTGLSQEEIVAEIKRLLEQLPKQ